MKKPITTTHNGRKFTLLSTGYFLDNNKKAGERLLHRIIWNEAHGPIPKGFDVHHKDENKLNNSIENFELKRRPEHRRDHMMELLARDPDIRKRLTKILISARRSCHDWLHTEAGRIWASNHNKEIRKRKRIFTCLQCGKVVEKSVLLRHKFCSKKCGCRAAYERRKARLALERSSRSLVETKAVGDYSAANEFAAYAEVTQ